MSAIIALIIIFLWGGLGYLIWWRLVKPFIRSTILKTCLTLLLAAVWFVEPVIDEILGAREFDQLCREMPPVKFYGPVAVGSGVFFDEQGRPKWKNSDEFSAIVREHRGKNLFGEIEGWEKIFGNRSEYRIIQRWPMRIRELYTIDFEKATGTPVVETFARYSNGGWLRSFIGIGNYQCPSRGQIPKSEEWIVFKANQKIPEKGE